MAVSQNQPDDGFADAEAAVYLYAHDGVTDPEHRDGPDRSRSQMKKKPKSGVDRIDTTHTGPVSLPRRPATPIEPVNDDATPPEPHPLDRVLEDELDAGVDHGDLDAAEPITDATEEAPASPQTESQEHETAEASGTVDQDHEPHIVAVAGTEQLSAETHDAETDDAEQLDAETHDAETDEPAHGDTHTGDTEAEEYANEYEEYADEYEVALEASPSESYETELVHEEALPGPIERMHGELVQSAVRREMRIAEVTSAAAHAIARAHQEISQSTAELDSLKDMLQGVAAADESQSYAEIERIQHTVKATRSEWEEIASTKEDLEAELLRVWDIAQNYESAIDRIRQEQHEADAARAEAEVQVEELLNKLTDANQANGDLTRQLDEALTDDQTDVDSDTDTDDGAALVRAHVEIERLQVELRQAYASEAALETRLEQAFSDQEDTDAADLATSAAATDAVRELERELAAAKSEAAELKKTQAGFLEADKAAQALEKELASARVELADYKSALAKRDVDDSERSTEARETQQALEKALAAAKAELAEHLATQAKRDADIAKREAEVNEQIAAEERKLTDRIDERHAELTSDLQQRERALAAEHKIESTKLQAELAETKSALSASQVEVTNLKRTGEQVAAKQKATARDAADLTKKLDAATKAHEREMGAQAEKLDEANKTHEAAVAKAAKARKDEIEKVTKAQTALREAQAKELDEATKAHTAELHQLRADHAEALATETRAVEQGGKALAEVTARAERLELEKTEAAALLRAAESKHKEFEAKLEQIPILKQAAEAAEAAAQETAEERGTEIKRLQALSDETHDRIGTLLAQIETMHAVQTDQAARLEEFTVRNAELEAGRKLLEKNVSDALQAKNKVIKGAESTAMLASAAEGRAEEAGELVRTMQIERDAAAQALTTAEARIVNLERELDRVTGLAEERVSAAFESATALGERAVADAEAKQRRISELEAQLKLARQVNNTVI